MNRRRTSIPPLGYLCKSATHWHMRAEEIRTLAEDAQDSTVRAMMLRIAADYDRLAGNAADRTAQDSIMFRVMRPEDKTGDGDGRFERGHSSSALRAGPINPISELWSQSQSPLKP